MEKQIKMFLTRTFMRLWGTTHRLERKVLFESFSGRQYSDNPRAISERLHELFPYYDIVWAFHKNTDDYGLIPDYVRAVNRTSLSYYKELSTSFCYVTNEGNGINIHKRSDQFFIQTWHGDRVPKKVLYDAWEDGKRPTPITDSEITDLCIAASDIGERVYRTAFRYKGNILKVGMPRNDKLVRNSSEEIYEIKQRLELDKNAKLLLYAPTFRNIHDKEKERQKINVDLGQAINILKDNNENWICMVRAHPSSIGLDVNCDSNCFIDVSSYPDMADLLLISDMLITDYSSSAGDFVLLNRPVILTMYDREEYNLKYRKFNFDPDEAGFIIARNQNELENIIKTYSDAEYLKSCKNVMKYFNIIETGDSAGEICRIIDKHYQSTQGGSI